MTEGGVAEPQPVPGTEGAVSNPPPPPPPPSPFAECCCGGIATASITCGGIAAGGDRFEEPHRIG